jgi:DNA repair protein RadC
MSDATAPGRVKIKSPEDVFRALGAAFHGLRHEVFKVLLLDSGSRRIRECTVSQGTLNASLVHPREVFKAAIDHVAASVVLAHNHPSGDPSPSAEDRVVTDRLVEAGRIVGIPVLDHVVFAGDRFISFAAEGWIKPQS